MMLLTQPIVLHPVKAMSHLTLKGEWCRNTPRPLFATCMSQKPVFFWGKKNSEEFIEELENCYNEVIHWKANLFKLPSRNDRKSVVDELTQIFSAFAAFSTLESIALKATVILHQLLLQKRSRTSKNRDYVTCIERRMLLWIARELINLLLEGKMIQACLSKAHSRKNSRSSAATSFAENVYQGWMKKGLEHLKG